MRTFSRASFRGATDDKSLRNNCFLVVCAVEDDEDGETGVQHSVESLLQGGNCVATAYVVNDKGIPSAAQRAIEFQYAEVVKQWKPSTGLTFDCLSSFHCPRVKRTGKIVIKASSGSKIPIEGSVVSRERIVRLAIDQGDKSRAREKKWDTWSPILY